MNWNHVKIYLAVAEKGSLLAAATDLGISPPTAARHIERLEHALGVVLFYHRHDGYRLTVDGERLLARARAMQKAAAALTYDASEPNSLRRVRLASGFWFSKLIAERLAEFHGEYPDIELELVTGHAVADLDNGEADISIRNIRPDGGDLVMRKLGESRYAIYGSKDYVELHPAAMDDNRYSDCDWIGAAPSLSGLASQKWLAQQLNREPVIRCSQTLQFLDAALSGVGLAILPQMIGDRESGLECVSSPISVGHDDIWLIVHQSMRNAPEVRAVINWLVLFFRRLAIA